jgi:hypothetical protein
MVRNTKRYTLTHRVATAMTQITIRGIPRHGKLKISDCSLLAQFGLTPKSQRGLAAGDVVADSICPPLSSSQAVLLCSCDIRMVKHWSQ